MNFSEALNLLKQGYKIKRSGWNGKDQHLVLIDSISYRMPDGMIHNHNNTTIGNKAILFVGALGTQVGWLASQGDLLADDWIIHDSLEE